ncbi:hypothetical protein [Streptomyces sp. NPDC051636]
MQCALRARQSRGLSHYTPQQRLDLAAQLHQLADAITDSMIEPNR